MALLDLFTRRTDQETPMTETTTTVDTTESTPEVVMQFLNLAGATVDLYRHTWTERVRPHHDQPTKWAEKTGFEWACRGCDLTGNEQRLRLSDVGYEEREPRESRKDANDHAATCRALPRPTN